MNFTQAIASGFKNYVGFSGRACRSEYWYWVLAMFILGIVTTVIDIFVFSEGVFRPITSIMQLAVFLPSLAVAIRRLHDLDRTGWWFLIIFTVIGAILLLVWFCMKGTTGPNRFGADPLGGG
jgi:uncharacterized membrane protein YhaH (DUF805 family)